ncbi:permease [Burkholderia sp. Bp9126]|nr:permease [Burkholderia sp. Bp9126]
MNKTEAKTRIAAMLSAGSTKSDVLAALSGQGVKDRVLAGLIASRPDPDRCRQNRLHVRLLIALGILQLLFCLWVAYTLVVDAVSIGPLGTASVVVIGLFLAVTVPLSLLFIWGFATYRVTLYHAYIALSIAQMPKLVERLATDPGDALKGLAISIALVVYVYFVRNRLFPDYVWFWPRKVEGRYVFAERG